MTPVPPTPSSGDAPAAPAPVQVSAPLEEHGADLPHRTSHPAPDDAFTRRWQRHMARRMEQAPEWFCAFLAGNSREKTRFKRDIATIRGSVVWLARQRRQGQWTAREREHLREVMRTASSVSPYLLIWVVPGSMLLLPFLAWFIDHRRTRRNPPDSP